MILPTPCRLRRIGLYVVSLVVKKGNTSGVVVKVDPASLSRMLGEWSQPGEALPEALADALLDLIDAGFVPAGCMCVWMGDSGASLAASSDAGS